MKIKSEERNIRAASNAIINYIEKNYKKIKEPTLFDIKLCVEEAMRNAIRHGNKLNKALCVNIDYSIENDNIKIVIEDQGNGFKVDDLPDPTSRENLYKLSGRGIYIMNRLMDRVAYNSKGNQVTMVKRLS
jgi:serine/threonine-protein kinase RsbW